MKLPKRITSIIIHSILPEITDNIRNTIHNEYKGIIAELTAKQEGNRKQITELTHMIKAKETPKRHETTENHKKTGENIHEQKFDALLKLLEAIKTD